MKRQWIVLTVLTALASTGHSRASDVEADPNKDYPLTPQAGPWLICASTFVGPQSPMLAKEMVFEIRSRFKLPAYVFNKGDEDRQKQREELRKLHEQFKDDTSRLRTTRIEDQCAVLIGGWKDMDSASKALKDIKKLPAPSDLKLMPVMSMAEQEQKEKDTKFVAARINPFPMAHVVHNSTVPLEKKVDKDYDALLRKINADEKFSVFKCRKPWTLVVAEFQGLSVIQSKESERTLVEKIFGQSKGSSLTNSARNAGALCELLRQSKMDAYVLHTTWGSVVCVGGFERPDDPQMAEVKNRLSTMKSINQGLNLLVQPKLFEIPKG
jgi:hypothetical protein